MMMVKVIGFGAFVCCWLLVVICSCMIQATDTDCQDKLFKKFDSMWLGHGAVKDKLDKLDPNVEIGGVKVDELVKFSDVTCHLETLTEQHFKGPEAKCKENDSTRTNRGLQTYVKYCSTERRKSCAKAMLSRLNEVVSLDDYEVLKGLDKDNRMAGSDLKKGRDTRPASENEISELRFSSCHRFIEKMQTFIPCHHSKLINLKNSSIERWYRIRKSCLKRLSRVCSAEKIPGIKEQRWKQCETVKDCLSVSSTLSGQQMEYSAGPISERLESLAELDSEEEDEDSEEERLNKI